MQTNTLLDRWRSGLSTPYEMIPKDKAKEMYKSWLRRVKDTFKKEMKACLKTMTKDEISNMNGQQLATIRVVLDYTQYNMAQLIGVKTYKVKHAERFSQKQINKNIIQKLLKLKAGK